MLSILGFLAVLGPLVVVHEFGHYIFARIFGVKAEVFSIGFGPRLWSRQMGETELRLSAIPLGGYVKLLGEEGETELPPEDRKRTLQYQKPWKRFFIFFGGPLFNFLFAILVFMAILAIGEPQISSVVGRVVQGSQAEQAGFRSGDRVISIDGKQVKRFEDIVLAVNESPDRPLHFEVARNENADSTAEEHARLKVVPSVREGFTQYGEMTGVGEIDGLLPAARAAQIGVSDPGSPAGVAGLKTGDTVVSFDGQEVKNWEVLEDVYRQLAPGTPVEFALKGEGRDPNQKVTFTKPIESRGLGGDFGMHSSELFVEKVVPDSPAEKAGIRPGDRLVSVGGQPVQSFFELKDGVQSSGEKDGKVAVQWEREGKIISSTLEPTATSMRDPLLKKKVQYTIGVMPMLVWTEPVTFVERIWNPFVLLFKGTERMAVFSWRNLVSLRKMVTGDVSIATLGGPILIGKIAGESLSRGLISFLTILATLSVGLGVLNILPIPVLDGGHLLLLAIESVRGKPLSIRQMEIVQQVGLSLILLLMVVVIRNDLARLPIFN